MRLLRRQSDGGLCLSDHIDDEIPPYAILSHTWGADEDEVSFEDIANGSGKNKAGYQKIHLCADQAQNDGVRFFWIDTCCIDKKSSAELSEAINCMFRWYQSARVCYVYLKDVTAENFGQKLSQSRWFTRGWTLQELIAPSKVLFFAVDGTRIGDKNSLQQQIHEVTRIPNTALQGASLDGFSIEERLSWGANRITKRAEDYAYCMLGLFSVNLPLIYGEGRHKAFRRLRKELGTLENDHDDQGSRLKSAVRMGKSTSVFLLLEDGASVNYVEPIDHHETILHAAVRSGSLGILGRVLEARPFLDPYSRQGVTPSMLACILGDIKIVEMLLDAGCFLNFRLQALRVAPVQEFDLDGTVTGGSTLLILAAQNGHSAIVSLLIDRGSKVDAQNDLGFTALLAAAHNNHLECVQILLAHQADVEARMHSGFTALLYCAHWGHIDIAKALLDAGADIEGVKPGNMTPLLEAAWKGQVDFIDFIVSRGADVTAQADFAGYLAGFTALHIGVHDDSGTLTTLDAAIRCGVPLGALNGAGETALEFARRIDHKAAVRRLETLIQ